MNDDQLQTQPDKSKPSNMFVLDSLDTRLMFSLDFLLLDLYPHPETWMNAECHV